MKRLITTLALAALATPALAEEINPDIAGTWNFSANIREACTFQGQAVLRPSSSADTDYTCELTARQACEATDLEYVVRQTCKVRHTRGQVSVVSTIEEFMVGEQTGYYYPDNFALSVQSESEMIGALVWPGGSEPATWVRADGSIS